MYFRACFSGFTLFLKEIRSRCWVQWLSHCLKYPYLVSECLSLSSSSPSDSSFLLMHTRVVINYVIEHEYLCGRPRWRAQHLALSWPSHDCCRNLGSKLADETCLSRLTFQINEKLESRMRLNFFEEHFFLPFHVFCQYWKEFISLWFLFVLFKGRKRERGGEEKRRKEREERKRQRCLPSFSLLPECSQQQGLELCETRKPAKSFWVSHLWQVPGCTLPGNWTCRWNWDLNPGIPEWAAGISRDVLTTMQIPVLQHILVVFYNTKFLIFCVYGMQAFLF